jgi:hypothetical protein
MVVLLPGARALRSNATVLGTFLAPSPAQASSLALSKNRIAGAE